MYSRKLFNLRYLKKKPFLLKAEERKKSRKERREGARGKKRVERSERESFILVSNT
jgi:hypothetical protein